MEIKVPELSLVVLIGVSGSGKSSFAKKLFKERKYYHLTNAVH
jgi:protein phosphatase